MGKVRKSVSFNFHRPGQPTCAIIFFLLFSLPCKKTRPTPKGLHFVLQVDICKTPMCSLHSPQSPFFSSRPFVARYSPLPTSPWPTSNPSWTHYSEFFNQPSIWIIRIATLSLLKLCRNWRQTCSWVKWWNSPDFRSFSRQWLSLLCSPSSLVVIWEICRMFWFSFHAFWKPCVLPRFRFSITWMRRCLRIVFSV